MGFCLMMFNCVTQSLCQLHGLFLVASGTDNQKFFPAHPADHIIAAGVAAENTGEVFLNDVAAIVTEGVVDHFKMIDIDHDAGQFFVITA